MWWPTQARAPLATQNVFLSSAPQASSGPGPGPGAGCFAARSPRERRISSGAGAGPGPASAATESSVRVWIGRSWTRKASAMPASRSRGVVVGVGDRLVGDVARGHHQRRRRRRRAAGGAAGCRAASPRGRGCRARRRRRPRAPRRRRAITMGRSGPRSSASSAAVEVDQSRAASRSAPSGRTACPRGAFARAASATAASSSARQARW